MRSILVVYAIFTIIFPAESFLFRSGKWDGLETTWNLKPLSNGFASHPRDLKSDMKGYVLKENYCAKANSPFVGIAYWKSHDPTAVLLFDVNGFIAGIQMFAPASSYTPSTKMQGHAWVRHDNHWVATAYFVSPSTICNSGRTRPQYDREGTGHGLWLQNGTAPLTTTIQIPTDEADISITKWTKGKCFPTMGRHYWHDLTTNMDCGDLFPYCLLYNDKKLDAFCFSIDADVSMDGSLYDSPHPEAKVLKLFMDPVPQCLYDDRKYGMHSTLHVYLRDSPVTSTNC